MASVLFLMKYPLHDRETLRAKFDGQMAAVRALGHEAFAIGWNPEGMWLVGAEEPRLLRKNRFTGMPGYGHTLLFIDLMAALRQALTQTRIDLVYLRYMPTFGNAVGALRLLKSQGGKLALEFPTYPRTGENRRSLIRRPVFAYTDAVLRRIHPLVDLYTVIGADCGGMLDGTPAMNIANGVSVDAYPLHVPNAGEETIRLLGVASMIASHGYDRILRAMAAYQGGRRIEFHLVGGDGDGSLASWKALAAELGLAERVTFHGPLYGDALNAVMEKADAGIGALAMHRFGIPSGTPLKCREYMARGLPFVCAGDSMPMPEDGLFCLNVPNADTPIDMEKVVALALRAKSTPGLPQRMRQYAREHMSWESVLGGVLERLSL